MKYNLSVTLTPLEYYFFGAENRHTDGTEKYLQTSLLIPQQTTLLGAMRFLVLQNAGDEVFADNKIQNGGKAVEFIGSKSFDVNNNAGFGKIKSLSEVLLWNKGFYCPLRAWEDRFEEERENVKRPVFTRLVADHNGDFFFDKDCQKEAVNLPEYNAKDGIQECWVNEHGQYLHQDEIFKKKEHAGNNKSKKMKNREASGENRIENEDDAYFKMNYYTLNRGFSFVFNMELTDDALINKLIKRKHNILVGGEQSRFLCEIERIDSENPKVIAPEMYERVYTSHADEDFVKVILTSDAFATENVYKKSAFAASSMRKTRFIKTKTQEGFAYHNIRKEEKNNTENNKENEKMSSFSDLYNMLERGSVLYFTKDVENDDIENIFKNAAFQTIGYNQFYTLTKKQQV